MYLRLSTYNQNKISIEELILADVSKSHISTEHMSIIPCIVLAFPVVRLLCIWLTCLGEMFRGSCEKSSVLWLASCSLRPDGISRGSAGTGYCTISVLVGSTVVSLTSTGHSNPSAGTSIFKGHVRHYAAGVSTPLAVYCTVVVAPRECRVALRCGLWVDSSCPSVPVRDARLH